MTLVFSGLLYWIGVTLWAAGSAKKAGVRDTPCTAFLSGSAWRDGSCADLGAQCFGRGDDTVGNPHRAQISQFQLFEFSLLLKLDKRFSIEQFEPTVSQSIVSSPPLLVLPGHRGPATGGALRQRACLSCELRGGGGAPSSPLLRVVWQCVADRRSRRTSC